MKTARLQTKEVVAAFDIASFTNVSAPVSSNELLDIMETYLNIIYERMDASGGTPLYLNGDAVAGFWPANGSRAQMEIIGRAIVDIMARVSALTISGNLQCVPAFGLVSGITIHATLQVAGRTLAVSVGEAMNRAMRLSSACRHLKKKILFPDTLPVIWPSDVHVEPVDTFTVKGFGGASEQLPIMSLAEK